MKEVPIKGVPMVPDPKTPIPRQIRYIIGNEGCERIENMQLLPRIAGGLDFLQ
jgi:hypothetical protein